MAVLSIGLALTACGGGSNSDEDPAPAPFDLTILHINDHHSTLDPQNKTLQLDLGNSAPDEVEFSVGGFPRVKQAMDELAAAATTPVIKLHAGDAMTGTLYFNRAGAEGEADAALMNTVCFDAFALGNHEFDKGDATLSEFLKRLTTGGCATQPLSANVQFGASSALHASRANGLVKPSMVIERDGEKIGVVGLTIAGKTRASSSPDADTQFEDEAVAAQREIDALTAQGVNKIVLLSHIGYQYDQQVIAKLRGVDVVVGGDSHSLLGPSQLSSLGVGNPVGDYPTRLTDANGSPVCLVQAWEYAQVVGELKVSFDGKGTVTACEGVPHVLVGDDFKLKSGARMASSEMSDATRQAITEQIQQSGVLRVTAPNAQASEVLKPYADKLEVFNETQVATVSEELCSRRVPGGVGTMDYGRSSASCNELGHVSLHGGDVQQMAAQAYLEITRKSYGGADISLQSGGGARVPLATGSLTAAQAISVLPFGNKLFKLTLTADEVKSMLEDGLDAVFGAGGSTGPYPYTGGLRFHVDAKATKGERISALEWHNPANNQWEALPTDRQFQLAVLSFNADGGDGYTTLKNVPAERRLDVGVLDSDVLFEYIASQPQGSDGQPTLSRLPTALYSTQSFVAP